MWWRLSSQPRSRAGCCSRPASHRRGLRLSVTPEVSIPWLIPRRPAWPRPVWAVPPQGGARRSEEHTSELQSHVNLVCRLLLEKKKKKNKTNKYYKKNTNRDKK